MTLQTIAPVELWAVASATARAFSTATIDANGEKVALIFHAPKAGNIDRVCFRTGTVTTGDTVDVRLETVDTGTGQPTGTLWATNTNASQVIANANDNTWFEVTLTAAGTVAEGDRVAVVVSLPAAGAVGNMAMAYSALSAGLSGAFAMNYTTSWSLPLTTAPVGAVRYSDGSYPFVHGLVPSSSINDVTFGTGSSPDERGNKITVPFACNVTGLWCKLASNSPSQTGDFDVVLYDDADNVLGSASHIGDLIAVNSIVDLTFVGGDVTLDAGQVVRAVKKPTTASTTAFSDIVAPSGAGSALPGGTASVYTERTDAGSWTDVSDRWAPIGLILSALDDGAGGGGGTTQGNLGTVLRGVAH